MVTIENVPDTVIWAMFNGTACPLLKVTVRAELVVPTTTSPKFKLVGEAPTSAPPEPDRLTFCVPALSTMVSEPVAVPVAVGENVT